MKMLPEIQAAIEKLPRQEFWKLAKWFDKRKEDVWDREIEEDAQPEGPLDKLAGQALEKHKAGLTVPLEEVLRHSGKPVRRPIRSRRRRRPAVRCCWRVCSPIVTAESIPVLNCVRHRQSLFLWTAGSADIWCATKPTETLLAHGPRNPEDADHCNGGRRKGSNKARYH